MGVYIKDMDLPTEESEPLRIEVYADGTVIGIKAQDDFYEFTAVPVPPHGDLVDRKELERYSLPRTEMIDGEIVQNRYVYLETVQQTPTIIPADKEVAHEN